MTTDAEPTAAEATARQVIAHIVNSERERLSLALDVLRDDYLTRCDFSTFDDASKAWVDGALQVFASIGELLAVRV